MNGHHIDTHTPMAAVLVDEEGNMINGGKTVTLMKANHHAGIGPVDDGGIPYALRTTVDDSKNWYKSMFNKVHKLSRSGEDENSNFVDTGASNPYRSRHSSTATERPVRIGSIFDYQPGDEYVVENKPVKQNINQPQAPPPTRTHQVDVADVRRNHNLSVGNTTTTTTRNNNNDKKVAASVPRSSTSSSTATRFSFDKPHHQQQQQQQQQLLRARPSSYHNAVNQLHSATPTYNRHSMHGDLLKPPTKYLIDHRGGTAGSTSSLPATEVMLSEQEWLTFFDNSFLYLPDEVAATAPGGKREDGGPVVAQQQGRGGSTAQSSSSSSYSDVFVRKTEAARRSSWIDHHHHNNNNRQQQQQQIKSTTDEVFADSNEMATKIQTATSNIDGRVKFDFGGQTTRELSVKKGQLIKIIHKKDANWFMCEDAGGKQGIVPIKYVEVVVPEVKEQKISSISGHANAKFDFAGNSKRELPFKKGDELELLKKIDNNWYRAKVGENSGIVPVTYITVVAEPKQETPNKKVAPVVHVPEAPAVVVSSKPLKSTNTSPRVTSSSNRGAPPPPTVVHHHHNISISKEDEPAENERKNRASILANTVVTNKTQLKSIDDSKAPIQYEFDLSELEDVVQSFDDLSTPRSNTTSTTGGAQDDSEFGDVIGRFVAQFPYQACNEDELDLQTGDVTHVVEICDDGWFVGTCERTRAFGTFPGNFVKAI